MSSRPVKYTSGIVAWHNSHGRLHREDGPAITKPNGRVYWWFDGEHYSFDDWCDQLSLDEKTRTFLRLKYA